MKKTLLAIALATASLAAGAAPIVGLYNTGDVFTAGSIDPDYTATNPAGVTTFGTVAGDNYPVGTAWMANNATSKWLSPTAHASDDLASGVYVWDTMFDMTGMNTAGANFIGRFAADNSAKVYLNNNLIGTSSGFTSWSAFSVGINSGFFNAGLNTLEFDVTNQTGIASPSGLRVEFTQSDVSPIPEPETYAMLLAGLGLMGFMARRRKA